MSTDDYTRRDLLKTCAAGSGFVALGSLAGCSDSGGDGDGDGTGNGNGSGFSGAANVPTNADLIMGMDLQGMLNDQNLRDVGNKFLEEAAANQPNYNGPTDVEGATDFSETMAGLNPDEFYGMTMFTRTEGTAAAANYTGVVMETGWTEDELVSALKEAGDSDAEVAEEQYQGQTIYTSQQTEDGTLGVLGDGNFVVGTEQAVRDMIDVDTGNAQAAAGDLAQYYEDTNNGHFRFASRIPEDQIPQDTSEMGVEGIDQLRYLSGSFYSEGNSLGMDINMHMADSSSATRLSDSVGGLLQFASGQMVENPDAREVINQIEVSASGQTMTMSYVESVEQINTYIETYATTLFGMSAGSGMTNLAPAAA